MTVTADTIPDLSRQAERLIELGVHDIAGLSAAELRALPEAVATNDSPDPVALPVACTLDLDDGAERARRWERLLSSGSASPRRAGRVFEIRFQPGPGVREELEILAAAEARCCTFVEWTVVVDQGQPRLQVTAPEDRPGDIEPIVAAFAGADSQGAL